jgi:hypothetical protein
MNILKRSPGDEFTFRLFFQLVSKIKQPHDTFYLWSVCIDPNYNQITYFIGSQEFYENEILYRNIIMSSIKTDLIVMGVKDHLTSGDYDMRVWLDQMARHYNSKKIIIFTSLENLVIDQPNVIIIPWGGDITNHQKEYKSLDPVLKKNFESTTTFLSLNRNQRTHRAMLLSLLYGLEIEHAGLISCMFKDKVDNLFNYTKWTTEHNSLYEIGFKKFKSSTLLLQDDYEIYNMNDNNNVFNFKNKLTPYYQNTFVEIITETSFTESCFNLTEKTLNSIYGCCFPIVLCSAGTVNFLREIGMDVFDDIVDHSYDNIRDPAERLYQAVTLNLELLTNNNKTKSLWTANEHRFINNIDFAKNKLYNFYSQRAENLLLKNND